MLIKYLTPIFALCLIGCSSSKQPVITTPGSEENVWMANYAEDDINFDVTCGFNYDAVILSVNGVQIYEGVVVTDESTGFADEVIIKKPSDLLEVELSVNGKMWNYSLNLEDGRFFNFDLHKGQIEIRQFKEPLYYD